MSKSVRVLLIASLFIALFPAIAWLHYALLYDDPAYAFRMDLMYGSAIAVLLPPLGAALVIGGRALHWHLRKPDVVIRVSAPPTPLEARFIEQDRRLEKRERLRGDLFKLNGEIETFAAELTPDERKAWQNRPGPYGK